MLSDVKSTFISIIIITKNNADTIEKCITSLINQDYQKSKYEIIFVDGRSNDGTDTIIGQYLSSVKEPTIKLFYEDVGKMGYARNIGIEKAVGEILCFIDGDAYPEAIWMTKISDIYEKQPNTDVVGGIDILSTENKVANVINARGKAERAYGGKAVTKLRTVNLAIRKRILVESGGFDPSLSHFDEAELISRIYIKHRVSSIVFDPDIVVYHDKARSSPELRIKKQFKKSIIGVPVLFRSHMFRVALANPLSPVGTSLQFVFASIIFYLSVFFSLLGILNYILIPLLIIIYLIILSIYTLTFKTHNIRTTLNIFFILILDSLSRFGGSCIGLIQFFFTILFKSLFLPLYKGMRLSHVQ